MTMPENTAYTVLSHLILRTTLKGRCYFRNEKKKKKQESQGDQIPGPRSHSDGTSIWTWLCDSKAFAMGERSIVRTSREGKHEP